MVIPKKIKMYMHCAKCLEELPVGMSPAEYSRYDVGFTDDGLQVWCRRHDINIDLMEMDETRRKFDA